MKNKIIGIFIFMLLIGTVIPVTGNVKLESTSIQPSSGKTLYVGGGGPGHYSKIQDAIDDAEDGDTVYVYDDSSPYYESLGVDKAINLIGENKINTVIDGINNSKAPVIDIKSNDVYISGFTITNGGAIAGIAIFRKNNIHIEQNIITDNIGSGINFHEYCENCKVINNTIKFNKYGILTWLNCDYFSCFGNEISNNDNSGLFLFFSRHCKISYNKMIGNGGTCGGLNIQWQCNFTEITNNYISSCGLTAIRFLGGGSFSTIRNNYVYGHPYDSIRITRDFPGDPIMVCSKIYHNSLYDPGVDSGGNLNLWDDGYPSGGNYWSDYTGVDNYSGPNQNIPGSDGIGDTPHPIYGGTTVDRYPLMEPRGPIPLAEFTWSPKYSIRGETIRFDASDSLFTPFIKLYEWDWDNDGVYDENHTSSSAKHAFEEVGHHPITLRVSDGSSQNDTITKNVQVVNQPPDAPTIEGEKWGKAETSYEYTFSSTDPDGDDIAEYIVNWSDGPYEIISGPFASGEEVKINHTWIKQGAYYVKAIAKDIYGYPPSGTTALKVTMPKNKPIFFNFPILNWLFERFPNVFPMLRLLLDLI